MLNKNTKMFLLLTLIFFTAVGLSAVSATDIDADASDIPVATQDIAADSSDISVDTAQSDLSNKNTQLNKKTVENVKSEGEGTFADLKDDINESEVTLTKDYIQGELETNITINATKTIDANGHTITAHNGTFIVNNNVTFTLKNAILYTEYAPNMPYPLKQQYYNDIDNHGNVTLENVTFHYTGTGRQYGAPVYMYSYSTINVTDCEFEGYDTNQAIIYGYNGNLNITVDNSRFHNYNTANAAIYNRLATSNVTVTNSNFTDAGVITYPGINGINYGGGLYINNANQVLIDNCLFDNITTNYRGAGIYTCGNTTVKDSTFRNLKQNATTYNGGAIYVDGNAAVLKLENNIMEDIVSNSADIVINKGIMGSEINIDGESITVDEEDTGELKLDVTDDNGNSIDFATNPFIITIENTVIPAKFANGTLTATFAASFDPGVHDVNITSSEKVNGTVTIPKITVTVNDIGLVKYKNVTALVEKAKMNSVVTIDTPIIRGGSEESIPISKLVTIDFKGNTIDAKQGKVFDIIPGAAVTIKNAIITNVGNPDVSVYNAEGRIANVSGGYVTFENVTFQNNYAPNMGSSATGSFILALFDDSYVSLKDCHVINCTGTFINNVQSTVNIDNTVFENNNLYKSYSESWNALIANGGSLDITNSQFINNSVNLDVIRGQSNPLAYSAYGGYYTSTNLPMTIDNTTFIDNRARSGRGTVNTCNDTTITNSVFINNAQTGSNKGGAILSENGTLDIDSCVFIDNNVGSSAKNGTTINNLAGNMYISNSIIASNMSDVTDVYNEATDVEVVANGNYWGVIAPDRHYGSKSGASEITVDDWVCLELSVTPSDNINYWDNVTIDITFVKTDGVNKLDGEVDLPDYEAIEFEATGAVLQYDSVDIVDGSVSNVANVTYNPAEIIASYLNDAEGITLDVNMPEPLNITLTDDNWDTYFDVTTGTINPNTVVPDSILKFDGVFNERDMVIDMPVTITTADNQAVLNNCTITVTTYNVLIKDIQMNSEDYADVLIELYDTNNVVIENNKLTITNNAADQITRAIMINGGDDNYIINNTIETTGPEVDVVYNGSAIKTLYTASIEAVGSYDLTIQDNRIFTEKNKLDATRSGTLYGVYVYGENYESIIDDAEIIGNTIVTIGDVYEYGITVNNAEEMTINYNTIDSTSKYYANAIQTTGVVNSEIIGNDIDCSSNDCTYGILLTGFYDWDTGDQIISEGNTVSENVIDLESTNAWGIEVFFGESNAITYNNITIDCGYGVGIGSADASYGDISYNNIELTATMEGERNTYDVIDNTPAGVKVYQQPYPSTMHSGMYNAIHSNRIIVDAPVATVPAVNVTVRSEITENYLVSPKGLGNNAVVNTASYGTTIQDNTPLSYVITNDTYANFFNEEGIFNNSDVANGSYLNVSGEIDNKDFIFDNVEFVVISDGTAELYNATIITQINAKVSVDGFRIYNTDKQAIFFESEGNELKNTNITVFSDVAVFPVEIAADGNTISNVGIYASVPSGDVQYGPAPDWKTIAPAPAALYIRSSNNVVDGVVIVMDGTESLPGWAPTTDGIYILSLDETISDNTITNSNVTVAGKYYVYGINVGNAKNTELDNVNVVVVSDNYADAVQLFDADTISINGKLYAEAENNAYGVYSTAMGSGISQNIVIIGSEINVTAINATGILIEGANNTGITETIINVEGANASAIVVKEDYMHNKPSNVDISRSIMDVKTDGDWNVLYFYNCTDVSVGLNTITANGGSKIFFENVPGASAAGNYVMIDDTIIGNHAFMTTEDDTVIEDNTPVNEEYEAMLELLKMYQTSIITIDEIGEVSYRDNLTITGKLNDGMGNLVPDQTLTITIGDITENVTTVNGLFEYTFEANQLGENTVTITYEGTENHNEANATTTFNVGKKESKITIYDIAAVTCNDDVTIKGKITSIDDIALGHVNVYIYYNGEEQHITTYKDGVFKTTFKTSTVGEQEVLVVYNGNTKYLASNATATFTTTGVKLVLYKINATYRDEYKVQGKLTDSEGNAIADAEIELTINDEVVTVTTDSNGKYLYTAKATKAGNITVTAAYDGGDEFSQVSVTRTVEVSKRPVTLTVDEISDVAVGEEVTVTGKLTDLTGTLCKNCNIVVKINGVQQKVKTDNDAVYTCTYTPTSAGTQNVTVTYKGNANYLGDEVTTTFEATA